MSDKPPAHNDGATVLMYTSPQKPQAPTKAEAAAALVKKSTRLNYVVRPCDGQWEIFLDDVRQGAPFADSKEAVLEARRLARSAWMHDNKASRVTLEDFAHVEMVALYGAEPLE
jgi:hypothetical protein